MVVYIDNYTIIMLKHILLRMSHLHMPRELIPRIINKYLGIYSRDVVCIVRVGFLAPL